VRKPSMRLLSPMLVVAALIGAGLSGCNDDDEGDGHDHDDEMGHAGNHGGAAGKGGAGSGDSAGVADVQSAAADLRVDLNLLLSEHLVLAAKATAAALGGRMDEYEAYGGLLNDNGTDVGALIGAAFGDAAEAEFNRIWSAHNGFFVDYTLGVAGDDDDAKAAAVANLTEVYVPEFAAFLAGPTGIAQASLTGLITEHVLTTKAIVDAQGEGDWAAVYPAIREAFAHMAMLGDPLSEAIAGKLSKDFPGDAGAASVDFRAALNGLLQEHMYLATFATGAALGGRMDEFAAAGAALNQNGTDIGGALGGLYGEEAETEFNRIWSAHNGFFVDYTVGVATDDEAKRDAAVESLTGTYVPEFAKFLAGATGLPEATLAELTAAHVVMTKQVVDAQGAGQVGEAADLDREGAHHMREIGDPLSAAIVGKLPEKF
jgi:hypothetical protein